VLFFVVFRAFKIASQTPDRFGQLLASGIGVWIGLQVFINLAGMVALLPLTGVPLPFISYGGSSLLAVLFAVAILLQLSRHTTKKA
jgi:cell division protein FtsW